jgi:hypothetical protein
MESEQSSSQNGQFPAVFALELPVQDTRLSLFTKRMVHDRIHVFRSSQGSIKAYDCTRAKCTWGGLRYFIMNSISRVVGDKSLFTGVPSC